MTQEYSENSPATRIAKVVNDGKLDGYEIVFLDDAVSTKHVFLEPISWSAAAMSIASGALSWLGTKAMERVSGEVTLEQLQQDTVEKFSRVLSKRLEEEALRKANAELKALERNISHFNNAPDTSIDRLYSATDNSIRLVSELESIGITAHGSFMVAAGLFLTILQQRYKCFKDEGEKKNIIESIDEYTKHAKKMHAKWYDWHPNRFSGVYWWNQVANGWVWDFEGKRHGYYVEREDAVKARKAHIKETKSAFEREYINPSQHVIDQWAKLRNKPVDPNENGGC